MLNYWWVTRPKRRLTSIPETLAVYTDIALNRNWTGERHLHLSFEDALENEGVKRIGERRDQGGGGGRTYVAWLKSLGLIFKQASTNRVFTTLAGEAILNGENPVEVLKNQVLKYQFPSSYSISPQINVSPRFKIHPFIFLLRLLRDPRIGQLTQSEIARVVIVEAENESNSCFEKVVKRIIAYRNDGDAILPDNFDDLYKPSKGGREGDRFGHLEDVANTLLCWMEYTRLVNRENGTIFIPENKSDEVDAILDNPPRFIDRSEEEEYFQRKYGLDPAHKRDNRDLTHAVTVTARMVEEARIRRLFISHSLVRPILSITSPLIEYITASSGCSASLVEDTLNRMFPGGTVGALDTFLSNYRNMAFSGHDKATDFETTTVEIMKEIFGYKAHHVGSIGKTPDVLVISDTDGYQGIFDNKAYARYSISNDHHNRMVTNYIGHLGDYNNGESSPLAFFSYIAGGFGTNIASQLSSITSESHVPGSAISIDNFIQLIKNQAISPKNHDDLRRIFSVGREVHLHDF